MDLKDIAYIVTTSIEILLPLILAIIIWKKFKASWAIFFLGIILFLISLIRIPLNSYIGAVIRPYFEGANYVIMLGLLSAFTIGIFEEGVRVLAMGAIIKPGNYYKGLMYGIGHGGGGEVMIFIGFTTLANYIIFKFFPNLLSGNILQQFESMIWYLPLIGAMEKVFILAIQIAFSVLIMHAFITKKYYIIPLTIIFHIIVDFTRFYINYKFGIWYSEIAIFIFAAIGIFLIFVLKPKKITGNIENVSYKLEQNG